MNNLTESAKTDSLNPVSIVSQKLSVTNSQFQWIDILRGLAALGVVLFHSRVDLWVGWQAIRSQPENFSSFDRWIAWLSIPLPYLGSGVILFFLLSGFCIHYPMASNERIELKSYAIRRTLRVLPPYLIAVGFSLLIEWVCNSMFGQSGSSTLLITRTIFMVQNYPPAPGQLASNPSLWSLPVEVELYIFYPFLFWLSHRIGARLVLMGVAVVSAIALIMILMHVNWWPEENFAKYWIIWCLGAMLAHLSKQNRLPAWRSIYWLPTLAALAAAIALKSTPYVLGYLFWAIAYFFLLSFCLVLPSPIIFLNKRVCNCFFWLGKISFSLYLIHFPLFRLLGNLWVLWNGSKPTNLLVCFAASLFAIFLASIFYTIVEKPAHLLARNLGKRGNDTKGLFHKNVASR